MSFLRTFRPNLILSTAPPSPYGTEAGTMRTGSSSKGPVGKVSSGGSRKNSSTGRTIPEESDRPFDSDRRGSSGTMHGRNAAKHGSSGRYGKENPAPIVVYLDKQSDGKKHPASILRTNTFTTHDEEPERVRNAITRSDTFTIDESNDKPANTGTYTRQGKLTTTTDVFEPLYAKNISLSSQEKLPVVVDSRTYRRKKSLKSSKPVQKVESFIKRFERTLFSKGNGGEQKRKGSTTSEGTAGTAGPRFRDVGINCKLDEEEKFKAKLEAIKRSRQSSRDSLVDHRERSLSPGKSRLYTAGTYDRRSGSSLSTGVVVQPLKEDDHSYSSSRGSGSPPPGPGVRSTLFRPTESSFLKSRQKEIEMGYSVVTKRQPGLSLGRDNVPDRSRTNAGASWRSSVRDQHDPVDSVGNRERQYDRDSPATSRYPARRDTYQTLKDEYERQRQLQVQAPAAKPVGIASPRMSAAHPDNGASTELPKYTFGTDMQHRRSRFQQFQKSFKKMDDSASEVSVQQSFFVPI